MDDDDDHIINGWRWSHRTDRPTKAGCICELLVVPNCKKIDILLHWITYSDGHTAENDLWPLEWNWGPISLLYRKCLQLRLCLSNVTTGWLPWNFFVLVHLLPDPRGKATSRQKGGWMIAQQNPVLGTQAPLCTDHRQVSWCARLKSLSQTCENQLSGLLGRRDGWLRGFPAPPLSRLCPLHDHQRRPSRTEGGHWIGGCFPLKLICDQFIFQVIPHLHFWLSLPKKAQVSFYLFPWTSNFTKS